MSVIKNEHDKAGRNVLDTCLVCGKKVHYTYPLLVWDGAGSITICGKCCQEIKVGFMEDLVEIAATMEMRQVRRHSNFILVRTTRQKLADQYVDAEAKGQELMRTLGRKKV
jgi:hypothetical protein